MENVWEMLSQNIYSNGHSILKTEWGYLGPRSKTYRLVTSRTGLLLFSKKIKKLNQHQISTQNRNKSKIPRKKPKSPTPELAGFLESTLEIREWIFRHQISISEVFLVIFTVAKKPTSQKTEKRFQLLQVIGDDLIKCELTMLTVSMSATVWWLHISLKIDFGKVRGIWR